MRHPSLRTKFIAGFCGLILLVEAALLFFMRGEFSHYLERELDKRGISIARHLAEAATSPILTENLVKLQLMVNDYQRNEEDIRYIYIVNNRKELLAHTFGEAFPHDLLKTDIPLPDMNKGQIQQVRSDVDERLKDVTAGIRQGDLGRVHVGITETVIRRNLRSMVLHLLPYIAAILGLGILMAILFAATITRPVKALAKGARMVGKGNLDWVIEIETRDEIGELAVNFNAMTQELLRTTNEQKRTEEELQLQAAMLEEEVAERQMAQESLQEQALLLENEIEERRKAQDELEKMNDELEQRVMLAELSADIGCILTKQKGLRDMLSECAQTLVTHLDAAFARIWTLNASENVLELQASAGMYTRLDGSHSRIPVGKFKIGLIAGERKPHVTNAVIGDPRVSDQEWAEREGMVAFAGHPLIIEDKLVGVMAMFSRKPLGEVTLKALASVSNEIAVGIERMRGEQERLAYLQFVENMNQVNRAIQGTNDLEKMLSDVLDAVLTIFDCDRAYLLYPCDPEAAWWSVPMERTKAEYPGANVRGLEIPMEPESQRVFRTLRGTNGPVIFGPESEYPLPEWVREQFGVQTQLTVAAYPKTGKPWMFGMHQCSYVRVWTLEEQRLFQEINRRLTDSLSSLLSHRDLQESEVRLRCITDSAQDAILMMDSQGIISFWNPAAEQIFGYRPDETIGKELHSLLVPERYRAAYRSALPEFQRTGRGNVVDKTIELFAIRKDGKEIAIELSLSAVLQSNEWHAVGIMRDISLRKQAEEEVRHLKNYLSNIIDSMPSMLVGMDRDEIVTQWNLRAEDATGIPASEAVGRQLAELIPEFSPWIKSMRSEVEQRRPVSMEKLLMEKDGTRSFYDLMLYPLVTNGVEGAVVRIEDVTEQARIQELMVQTEKMMSVGGLAAGMAHEINNPLGIITQAAQNIERRVSPELAANQEAAKEAGINMDSLTAYFQRRQIPEFIGSIREATDRASRIIANILRFSRRTDATMRPAPLADIVEQALELAANDYDLKKKYDFRSIDIVREFEPDMPDVPMVALEMEQVMLNLLKNAAQAMAANPPQRRPRITLRLKRAERYSLMAVEDNGQGMTEEVRRRVFEPFFTTKEPGVGTGLGLSVSYMIVTRNHKGLMEVVSSPGNGACFTVKLPLHTEISHE